MKRYFCFLILFITSICHSATLTQPIINNLFLAPSNYNGISPLANRIGNCAIPNSGWHVVQWNIKQDLLTNCKNFAINQYASVVYLGNNYWELGQSGVNLECEKEFNLFIEANRFTPQGLTRSSPLSQLQSLNASVNAYGIYEKIGVRCKTNVAGALIAFVLDNPVTKQTLYYQIILRDSRVNLSPYMSWCPSYEKGFGSQFCVDDDIRRILTPASRLNTNPQRYYINILPRLIAILQSKHTKLGITLDSNLSNWTVGSVYFGNKLNGESYITTRWSNFKLSETLK